MTRSNIPAHNSFMANQGNYRPHCWLAKHGVMEHGDPMPPCAGELIRAHLIPRQVLNAELTRFDALQAIHDPRSWVWACGGPMGNAGHHGMFDTGRILRVPRTAIPSRTEMFAVEIDLTWWLDREYGSRALA
jgi:hypothetical protein